MSQFSYQTSLRVKKARLANKFGHFAQLVIRVVFTIILLLSLLIIFKGLIIGYSLAALALAISSFEIWLAWDLKHLEVKAGSLGNSTIALDQVLASDIVTKINLPISPKALWQTIASHWQAEFFLARFLLDPKVIEASLTDKTEDTNNIWQSAQELCQKLAINEINVGVITTAILITASKIQQYLLSLELDKPDIINGLEWQQRLIKRYFSAKQKPLFGGVARDWAAGFTPVLDQFGQNISLAIEKGKRDFSAEARTKVIEQMLLNLGRGDRTCLALVGEPGVGKSSLVYSLADKMIRGEAVPANLAFKQIVQLDAGLIAGFAKQAASLEAVIYSLVADSLHAGNIILFMDEAELFFTPGAGSIDLSQIFLQLLEQTKLSAIIAMAPADWQKFSTVSPALSAKFTKIEVSETDADETLKILEDIALPFEARSKTTLKGC